MGGTQIPPGFRFVPTDEELIFGYLWKWVDGRPLPSDAVKEANVYGNDPWQLPGVGHDPTREPFYFFATRNLQSDKRTNRKAGSGSWKITAGKRPIKERGRTIGFRTAMVFKNNGRNPSSNIGPNWIMHEYTLSEGSQGKALCKIYQSSRSNQDTEAVVPPLNLRGEPFDLPLPCPYVDEYPDNNGWSSIGVALPQPAPVAPIPQTMVPDSFSEPMQCPDVVGDCTLPEHIRSPDNVEDLLLQQFAPPGETLWISDIFGDPTLPNSDSDFSWMK